MKSYHSKTWTKSVYYYVCKAKKLSKIDKKVFWKQVNNDDKKAVIKLKKS